MSWGNDSEDRVAIVQMNAELRHAQLELLSAQCATDRVRLRFSIEQIARHAHADTLRKVLGTVTSLHQYYSSIEKQRANASIPSDEPGAPSDEFIRETNTRVASYFEHQRNHYFAQAKPLPRAYRLTMERFFSHRLLAAIRTVELAGKRIPNPPFYAEAKVLGLGNLPEMTHLPSLTFVDVLVFNERITERTLFHALVHAVQFQVLGLERYTEIFVRAFLRRRAHYNVPLEAQAIALEAKFASQSEGSFNVEEQIWLWLNQGRYSLP
jgi:hypothetical protein